MKDFLGVAHGCSITSITTVSGSCSVSGVDCSCGATTIGMSLNAARIRSAASRVRELAFSLTSIQMPLPICISNISGAIPRPPTGIHPASFVRTSAIRKAAFCGSASTLSTENLEIRVTNFCLGKPFAAATNWSFFSPDSTSARGESSVIRLTAYILKAVSRVSIHVWKTISPANPRTRIAKPTLGTIGLHGSRSFHSVFSLTFSQSSQNSKATPMTTATVQSVNRTYSAESDNDALIRSPHRAERGSRWRFANVVVCLVAVAALAVWRLWALFR